MHPFRLFICRYTPVSDSDWASIEPCLERIEVKKQTMLLTEGKVCRYLFFLEQGLLRFFIWNDGTDVTKFFTESPYTFTSQRSFSAQLPARESIEVLQDSVVWRLTYEDANRLLANSTWASFVRQLIQQVQGFTEDLLEAVQTQTAEDRYRYLIDQEPQLVRRVPLKHLASYLGIAPQSLSRIRRSIQQGEKLT